MRFILKFPLRDQALLKCVYRFAKTRKIRLYLVGGALRDALLGRLKDDPDYDFCLKKNAINFGRSLSRKLRAGFVVLDKEHGACRIVKKVKDHTFTLDFTDFRGSTLEEDLLHRDFTINAIAFQLEKVFDRGNLFDDLIDLYQGIKDLEKKRIRIANKKSFSEDPLRILRAFSFSCLLGFKIEKETLRSAELEKHKLKDVSLERIRDELFKILDSSDAYRYIVELDKLKILKVILPEIEKMRGVEGGPYHHLDVWGHSLEALKQLEIVIEQLKSDRQIQDYLNQNISAERKRKGLIKLGAILHDIGKPKALRREGGKIKFHGHERIGLEMSKEIARRLRLSCDEITALQKMVLWHLRPGYLADNDELTPRAIFRYLRDTDQEAVSTLLLSLADQRATRGPLTTKDSRVRHEKLVSALIEEYYRRSKQKKLPRLINGDELMKKFHLEPSPLIGKILSEIEELQAIGKIKNKTQAFKVAVGIVREIL